MRDLQPGDVIHCKGITYKIKEIIWQVPWEWRQSYDLEFYDTDGNYRSWEQDSDGGYIELKGKH